MELTNQAYLGNCLELMEEMPSNSVDLIICDGPYGVTTHDWDAVSDIQTYNLNLIKKFSRILREGGSLYLFGKSDCLDFIDYRPYLQLNSKIIWFQPSRLAQGRKSYTNNYDIIAYFSKGKAKTFNLDAIRVPQLVELTHRLRCENVPSVKHGQYGKTKFNDLGKNPGDVWGDIKQLTYNSKELISRDLLNTIQKPQKLIDRLVLASSNEGDLVFDPFAGTGTTAISCLENNRNYLLIESNKRIFNLSQKRISSRISLGISPNLIAV